MCHDEQKYLPYLPTYACAGRFGQIGLIILYTMWLLVMFYSLSEVAEGFLVPAVEVRRPETLSCVLSLMLGDGAGMENGVRDGGGRCIPRERQEREAEVFQCEDN